MAISFKRTSVKPAPKIGEKITTDTIYWKNLEVPVTKKEYGAITDIDFSPVAPHQLAVTNSTRVQVYNSTSLQIHKTISRFKEVAYGGSFRDDGRLLVVGGDEGLVRLFDVEGKSLLRMFKGHTGSVRVTKFLSSRTQILSGSDDNSVKVWDIPAEKEINTYAEHKDYVRCGVTSQASKDIVLTGSYDHTVKMFDTRIGESSIMTVEHGAPVESVLMFPAGGVFISAEDRSKLNKKLDMGFKLDLEVLLEKEDAQPSEQPTEDESNVSVKEKAKTGSKNKSKSTTLNKTVPKKRRASRTGKENKVSGQQAKKQKNSNDSFSDEYPGDPEEHDLSYSILKMRRESRSQPVTQEISATPVPPAVISATPSSVISATPVPPAVISATPVPPAVISATPVPPAVISATPVPPAVFSATPVPPAVISATPVPPAVISATPVPPAVFSATPVPPAVISATQVPPSVISASPSSVISATPVPPAVFSATPVPPAVISATPSSVISATPVPPAVISATPVPPAVISGTQVPPAPTNHQLHDDEQLSSPHQWPVPTQQWSAQQPTTPQSTFSSMLRDAMTTVNDYGFGDDEYLPANDILHEEETSQKNCHDCCRKVEFLTKELVQLRQQVQQLQRSRRHSNTRVMSDEPSPTQQSVRANAASPATPIIDRTNATTPARPIIDRTNATTPARPFIDRTNATPVSPASDTAEDKQNLKVIIRNSIGNEKRVSVATKKAMNSVFTLGQLTTCSMRGLHTNKNCSPRPGLPVIKRNAVQGGNVVKVWDALAGGKLLTTLSHHHKTVTCLCFCSQYKRLMSAGLDRHVKIYDVGTYQVVHTLDYPGAILSLGVSPDDSLVAVGTVEGLLSLQRRKPDTEPVKTRRKPVSYRYGLRGKTYIPNREDHIVEHRRKEQLAKYDRFFKRFEHSKALDAALEVNFHTFEVELHEDMV